MTSSMHIKKCALINPLLGVALQNKAAGAWPALTLPLTSLAGWGVAGGPGHGGHTSPRQSGPATRQQWPHAAPPWAPAQGAVGKTRHGRQLQGRSCEMEGDHTCMIGREGGRKGGRKEEGEGGERKRSNGDGQGIDPLRSRPSADQPIRTPFRALVRTAHRPRSSAFRRGRPGRSERAAPATHTHTHTHAHTRQGRAWM